MKRYVILSVFLIYNSVIIFAQANSNQVELTLQNIIKEDLVTIIDSVVSFSERCEKEDLKFLTFELNIREVSFNSYQIIITLVNCQGLNIAFTTMNRDNKAYGYFIHKDRLFIVTGCRLIDILQETKTKRFFVSYDSEFLWNADYTTWYYCHVPDEKIKLLNFQPVCISEKNKVFPVCNDSTR